MLLRRRLILALLTTTPGGGAAGQSLSPESLPELLPPVAAACISSPFGPRVLPGTRASGFHNGVDFPAPIGAFVHAAAAGEVAAIRRLGADGLEVDLQHSDPAGGHFVTRYAHLGSVTARLASGEREIAAGEAIGRVGRSGITYGTHVHFEVRIDGKPVDPEPLFHVKRCGGKAPASPVPD